LKEWCINFDIERMNKLALLALCDHLMTDCVCSFIFCLSLCVFSAGQEQTKRKEFEEILTEEQEEMALAIEEQYLQRIAIAKQFEVAENNLREEHSQHFH